MNLCKALGRHAEVTLFCDGKLYDQASARGIDCRRTALGGRRWLRFLPWISLPGGMRRELAGFDVVHAYSVNVLPRLFTSGRPLVWTTHGYWERPYGMRARVIDAFVKRVVTVSTDVDQSASFGVKQRKIYLGTPLSNQAIEPKSFDLANVRIVCVGRFQRIKGQDMLLSAMAALAAAYQYRTFTLELIGDVNGCNPEDIAFRDELHALAAKLRMPNLEVRFCGFQKQPAQFIQASDFVVIPSRYESFSMVAIEALACGKPVIAPAIGGPKDIIDSEKIGILFDAGDAEALKCALERAIAGFDVFSSEACVQRARAFSVERQAEEHIRLYREIACA